jgi:hypothetical protein
MCWIPVQVYRLCGMCNAVYVVYLGLRVKLSRMKIWSRSGSNQSGQLPAWSAWWAGTPAACWQARVGHGHWAYSYKYAPLICVHTLSLRQPCPFSNSHVLPCFTHTTVHGHATTQYMLYSSIVENHSHSHAQPYSYMHSLISVHACTLTQAAMPFLKQLHRKALFHSYNSACPLPMLLYNSNQSLT